MTEREAPIVRVRPEGPALDRLTAAAAKIIGPVTPQTRITVQVPADPLSEVQRKLIEQALHDSTARAFSLTQRDRREREATADHPPLPGATTRALRAELELLGGEAQLSARLYTEPLGFWERVKNPEPQILKRARIRTRIDATLSAYLPRPAMTITSVEPLAMEVRDPLALACDDLDQDGLVEIAVVGRSRIVIGRPHGGELEILHRREWNHSSPIAPAPLKEPIASVRFAEGRFVEVGLSDRADALRLDEKLELVERYPGRIPWPGHGCSVRAGLGYAPTPIPCEENGSDDPPLSVDAFAGALVVGTSGGLRQMLAAREQETSELFLWDGRDRVLTHQKVGAQLLVTDWDRDGTSELFTTRDTLDPTTDGIHVFSWHPDGALLERVRHAIPTGVYALAVCPPEDLGLTPVLAASPGVLWRIH